MTSKEALEGLIDAYISWRAFQTRECIENDYRYKKLLKDLDRLEELEIENDELKRINGAYQESNIVFQDLIKKLKKTIEIILKYKINPSTFIFTRKIYKESCGKDLTFEKAYSLLDFGGTQEEYELLNEVLCDE